MAGDKAQHLITQRMAETIVEAFEMIDIEHCGRQRLPGAAGFGLHAFERFKGAAAVEHAGKLIGDRGAFGGAEFFRQRACFGGRGGKLAFEPGVGDLHCRGGGAQLFEQGGKAIGIERAAERGAAIGNGAAIIGKIGAPGLDPVDQRFGLIVRGGDQRLDIGAAHLAAMRLAQRRDGRKIEPAQRDRGIDRQRQIMVFIADVAPEQIIDIGLRRQGGGEQQRADLVEPVQRRVAGGRCRHIRHQPTCLHRHYPSPFCTVEETAPGRGG